jgi:hypothetical protein
LPDLRHILLQNPGMTGKMVILGNQQSNIGLVEIRYTAES